MNVIAMSYIFVALASLMVWVSVNFRRGTHGKMLKLSLLGTFPLVYDYAARTVQIIYIGLNS